MKHQAHIDDSQGIEDVIVTATRRETNIMETPLADISRISRRANRVWN